MRLLAELRAEVARADGKASVLVGAQSMAASVLIGLLAGRGWHPSGLSAPSSVVWWAGVASMGTSLVALLFAVLPRYKASDWRPGRPVTYFGDIRRAADQEELSRALADTERAPMAGLVDSLTENSRIVSSKHRWMRVGLLLFCAGAVLTPGALLVG
ncbi:hypothetical protein F0L17_15700 [Streptomyces sp. TRM43335]|uniref:Pycsar effector protein domain-containing protein n=1 Tax=Streptomyces taklimakanensis TaxID=2569853 RepID=A0A6G2BEN3_9ACTN|nr:Pycsar system effector family protein [Streptomyces taklimakanensis]MTE20523.1 hypothetical protein [Streptomyces taklimakanensis]